MGRLSGLCPAMLLIGGTAAFADVQVIQEAFPGSAYPTPGYDVSGNPAWFDIDRIELAVDPGNSLAVSIFTNYSTRTSGTSLAPWLYPGSSLLLGIGGLFFGVPVLAYGVPLYSHGGFVAGTLYGIDGVDVTKAQSNVFMLAG